MNDTAVAENKFLDGKIRLLQPKSGYRAATDPVLLAAAVPAAPGASVLDLGCGVGTASLCLAVRVGTLDLHGLELQTGYAELARQNAALNGLALTVHEGDVAAMPGVLRQRVFDATMLNPPWFEPSAPGSPVPERDIANRGGPAMADWMDAALSRTRPGGHIVVIQRSEALPAILSALAGRAGEITVLPLAARPGRPAKRVVVRARKGSRAPFRLAPPLVLHDGAVHAFDGDDYSDAARAVLRDGAALNF